MNKKILLTGAHGFTGCHFIETAQSTCGAKATLKRPQKCLVGRRLIECPRLLKSSALRNKFSGVFPIFGNLNLFMETLIKSTVRPDPFDWLRSALSKGDFNCLILLIYSVMVRQAHHERNKSIFP
jgi:hypothetical protein